MHNSPQSLSKDVLITNNLGLHARPAAMIAKLAKTAQDEIWIIKDNQTVDASSIIDILSIGCGPGSRITVKIENVLDLEILESIIKLVETGFEE